MHEHAGLFFRLLIALVFTEEVDPTALATFALAVATLATVVLALRSLSYTKRALAQADDQVDLSRREVEEAHRPVLVPVVDATRKLRPDRPDSPSTSPYVLSRGILWVPIENIGSGPALSIEISVALSDETALAVGDERTGGAIAGLGAGHRLPVEIRAGGLMALTNFGLTIFADSGTSGEEIAQLATMSSGGSTRRPCVEALLRGS
jgi:hypothetical protein